MTYPSILVPTVLCFDFLSLHAVTGNFSSIALCYHNYYIYMRNNKKSLVPQLIISGSSLPHINRGNRDTGLIKERLTGRENPQVLVLQSPAYPRAYTVLC